VDEAGDPLWRVEPLSLPVFAANARRYGYWFDDLAELAGNVTGPQVALVASV
jgi:hypothetical protein